MSHWKIKTAHWPTNWRVGSKNTEKASFWAIWTDWERPLPAMAIQETKT